MDDDSWIAVLRASFALAEGASQTRWGSRIGQVVHGLMETETPDGEADVDNLEDLGLFLKQIPCTPVNFANVGSAEKVCTANMELSVVLCLGPITM